MKAKPMKKLALLVMLGLGASTAYAVDGAAVYQAGGTQSCAYCHGPDGAGYPRTENSRRIPPIAGLPTRTVEVFLRATKQGYVKEGIKKMHERAVDLSDDEIDAVAQYIHDMHRQRPR